MKDKMTKIVAEGLRNLDKIKEEDTDDLRGWVRELKEALELTTKEDVGERMRRSKVEYDAYVADRMTKLVSDFKEFGFTDNFGFDHKITREGENIWRWAWDTNLNTWVPKEQLLVGDAAKIIPTMTDDELEKANQLALLELNSIIPVDGGNCKCHRMFKKGDACTNCGVEL